MEFSPLYTRRLSGSSSLNSFKEDALEQLEFNINDISRASSPASVISTSARSEGHSSSFRDRRYRNSGRGSDEYRRKYSTVKTELDLERIKSQQLQQERLNEMRKWKDAFENERKLEMVALQKRMEEEKKREIARLKEEMLKQKDFELQQVLIYKESDRKYQHQQQKEYRVVENKEKDMKLQEERVGEKGRADAEENEEFALERDADNDVAVASEKARGREGGRLDDRRKRRSIFGRRSLELDSRDGGTVHEHKKSSRELKTVQSQDGYEADKERGSSRRRGSGVSSRLLEKVEILHVATAVEDASLVGVLVSDNTTNKSDNMSTRTKDAVTSTKDLSSLDGHISTSLKDSKYSPPKKLMIDEQTQMVCNDNMGEDTEKKKNERELMLKEFGEKITVLESEKSALLKQKDEIQRTLDLKCKEHKIREEEFMTLRAGYDRELRIVINEHKKIALGNLEKLKLAETVLKEAMLSDEEIAMLSQRSEQHRRLSSSSLPADQFQKMSMMMERSRERRDSEERRSSVSSYEEYEERVPQQIHISTKKEDKEREKQLQKKLGELATQIQRLERRIALLRTENEALRKKQDDQKPLEEKIRSLKKRNAELAAIARRLEDKAKALQQENVKVKIKTQSTLSQEESSPEVEHLKRVLARQRAKDLSEHAKNMLAKDKEIEDLRRKCHELAEQLSNAELMLPQNAAQFEEKEELVNIIKQAAKERLQLEQQLTHSKTKETSEPGVQLPSESQEHLSASERYRQELEAANEILHKEIEKLELAVQTAGNLEQKLTEKTLECASLSKELSQTKHEQEQLEVQLSASLSRNERLHSEVRNLQGQLHNVDQITEECNTLKLSLASAQKERETAEEEVKLLSLRVHSLENVVRDLQESAEHASHVDNERKAALQQLQQKQAQLEQLQQVNSSVESRHAQTISALNKQVLELEEKRRVEKERREELAREVQRLQKEAEENHRTLEEAERIRSQIAAVSDLIPAPQVVTENQTALSANIKKGQEGDGEEKETVKEGMDRKALNQNERSVGESLLSSWARKGPIQVYIAKYNYDPFEFSPNENPEAELPLTAGDYVLVVGEMDEDGFFDGELIDGRQGLVPSNFIEKVEEEDLLEFHAALLQAGHGDYSNANNKSITPIVPTTTVPAMAGTTSINNNNNDMVFPGDEVKQLTTDQKSAPVDNPEETFSDLEDIAEIDEDDVSVNSRTLTNGAAASFLPPCPKSLSVDRQLTNSLLVSWRGPDPVPGMEIHSYHILVDGQLKTSVKSNERMKALLEGVNSSSIHRLCVRCVSNKGQSKDAQCTMLIGKDIYPVPSELKISHLSPTSASLSWLPGNSNYQHAIVVNGKEVKVVKPGVFRHTLTGLVPGKLHKVTLIAKSISGALNEEKSRKWVENVSASIEFCTPESAGAPEPPLNVQVESGPRDGTILLTWLPVTINSSGVCNGAIVTGYHVMADGRKVSFVAGPTSDHAVLSSGDFKGLIPCQLSVRTVSTSGVESVDSELVLLPQSLINEMTGTASTFAKPLVSKAVKSPSSEEQKGHDTDEEIEEAFREAQNLNKRVNAISEPYSDSSSSELSDIPEVEEDLIGSQDSRLSEVNTSLTNQMNIPSQAEKVSPQPAARKLMPSVADTGPKEFHAQKPTGQAGKLLAAPSRTVPAIEIIRDSSTERGTSADEDAEEGSTLSAHSTPTNVSGKGRLPDAVISSSYHGDDQNPSAFRHVDQARHKDSAEVIRRVGMEDDGQDKYSDFQVKGSKAHPTNSHPVKSTPHDTRTGRDRQSPSSKHRHNKTQNPWSDSAQSPDHRKQVTGFSSSPISPLDDPGDTDSISGEINPVVDANTVRLFIALFDYDPVTMSPNVDSIDEELPFREGQILKVFGDKDVDGFYKGENLGRVGYIPCNMVSEVQIDDPEIVEQLLQETAERLGQTDTVSGHLAAVDDQSSDVQLTPNGVASVPREGPIMRKMIALYDYDPQELSPNVDAEMELSFKTGDIVMIYGDMDEDGFYTGEINGQQGLIPSNFLQPAPSSEDDGLESESLESTTRSRSGESLDVALNALARKDITTNTPKIGDHLPSSTDTSSKKQPVNVNFSEIKSEGSRPGTSSPADDEKPKKKGGFLNKSKNIFKKFTR